MLWSIGHQGPNHVEQNEYYYSYKDSNVWHCMLIIKINLPFQINHNINAVDTILTTYTWYSVDCDDRSIGTFINTKNES